MPTLENISCGKLLLLVLIYMQILVRESMGWGGGMFVFCAMDFTSNVFVHAKAAITGRASTEQGGRLALSAKTIQRIWGPFRTVRSKAKAWALQVRCTAPRRHTMLQGPYLRSGLGLLQIPLAYIRTYRVVHVSL